ncbi:MAG: DUF4878 domain-containing protein [Chitinophagaceae bacterium]|nr:MAG: DUF4878 domain-containing protein [Chitinophagaceae bacterium]
MKKVLLAAFAGTMIMLASCNTTSGDPKAVLSQFFTLLSKKDLAGARKLATTDSKSMLDMMEMAMKTSTKELDKYDVTKMEYGEAKIDGDRATVPVKEKESGETVNYVLKKEDGAWKVAFDKATIMGMATDKMNEKGVNMSDSISNAIDELKKMDTDSLNDALKESHKELDSAQKMLEEMNKK